MPVLIINFDHYNKSMIIVQSILLTFITYRIFFYIAWLIYNYMTEYITHYKYVLAKND